MRSRGGLGSPYGTKISVCITDVVDLKPLSSVEAVVE